MTGLPDPKWKDGPPEGKEVVRTFTVTVSGTQHDPDDDDEDNQAREIERVLAERFGAGVSLVETEDV